MMPRIRAQAMEVRVTLPKETDRPPIPVMRMTETTNRLRFCSKSTFCTIFRPDTAIKPYRAIHTPPITQGGMVLTKATKGLMKAMRIAPMAAARVARGASLVPGFSSLPSGETYSSARTADSGNCVSVKRSSTVTFSGCISSGTAVMAKGYLHMPGGVCRIL